MLTSHSVLKFVTCCLLQVVICINCIAEQSLRVCFWNVESGGASSTVNSNRIKDEQGIDIWGLSEVKDATDAAKYQLAAKDGEPDDFESLLGTTGSLDRLLIIYNSSKIKLIEAIELHDLNIGGNVRAPLAARFQLKRDNREFWFMVNHLYRSNESARHTQAKKLNIWAKTQQLPAIIGGDMNFDWHFQNGLTDHDKGYDYLVEDGVLHWIEPTTLVPTNSSSHQSVLDFVFVSGTAMTWQAESNILVKQGDFPDGNSRSDHRPVDCIFTIPDLGPIAPSRLQPLSLANAKIIVNSSARELSMQPMTNQFLKSKNKNNSAQLLKRIEQLQRELDDLKEKVR